MRLSSNGFTFLETLLAAAIGVIILGGLMSALSVMAGFSHRAAMGSGASSFEQEIANAIKQGPACTAAMTAPPAQTFNPSLGATSPLTLHGMTVSGQTGAIDITVGTQVIGTTPGTGVQVTQLSLVPLPVSIAGPLSIATAIPTVAPAPAMKSWPATLHMQTMKMAGGTSTMNPPIDIPVRIMVDGTTNVIKACNMDTSEADVCTEIGGRWDPTQTGAARCTPKSTCEMGGSYTDQGAPGAYPNPLTNLYNCPTPQFQAIRSGTVSQAIRTSKYKISNQYFAVYTCVKCGTTIGAPPGGLTTVPEPSLDYSSDANTISTTDARVGGAAVVASPTP